MKSILFGVGSIVVVALSIGVPLARHAYAQAGQPPNPMAQAPHKPAPGMVMERPTITAKGAQAMIDAVTAFAANKSVAVSIAVVDAGGNLVAFKRMDGTSLGTIQAVLTKSVSALRLQASTSTMMDLAQQNPGLGFGFTSAGFTILGGAQPIKVGDQIVGAIAVSGGAGPDDDDYVKVGLDAFKP
jgi:uncharacterized protein GlcG (DUF336 family)